MIAVQSTLKSFIKKSLLGNNSVTDPNYINDFYKKQLAIEVLRSTGVLISALKEKKSALRICSVGHSNWLSLISEVLSDINYDPKTLTFYGLDSKLFNSAPINDFNENNFDLIISKDRNISKNTPVLDLDLFIDSFTGALIETKDLLSCLNPRKLVFISLGVYFSPKNGAIVESGCYKCGSTVFYSKFQRRLGLNRHIYAIDTFEGMPAATDHDKGSGFVYDTGMFTDNSIDEVRQRVAAMGEASAITLIKGLVQDSVDSVCKKNPISFAFLDSDQYIGTHSSLAALENALVPGGIIIVDDTTVSGVVKAIKESCEKFPWVWNAQITQNFDLITKDRNLINS